ncbi:hypothetical protein BDR22DRAFT_832637 [Usnea florida]
MMLHSSHTLLVFITLSHWTYIIFAATPPALSTLTLANTTVPPEYSIECVTSDAWVTRNFIAGDCFTALAILEDWEVSRHGAKIFEFLAASITPPYPSLFAERTPRKYMYKSCTVTIALLADVPPGLVPHLPEPPLPQGWRKSELCDYASIERAGLNIRDGCLSVVEDRGGGAGGLGFVNPAGYKVLGMAGAMGIFLWDSNSVIDGLVRGEVDGGEGGNGSVRGDEE